MVTNILDPSLNSCTGLEVIVCMNPSEICNSICDQLLDLECKVYVAKSPADAMAKLQIHAFHIVVMEENYNMEIMQLLACLPMAVRRNMFYILLGTILETNNAIQSYIVSANLVINLQDVPSLGAILQNQLMEHNYFYRAFYYALQAITRQKLE